MHSDAFAAGHIADDRLSANGITTARAVDEQIALALDADGVGVIAAKHAAHDAAKSRRTSRASASGRRLGSRGRQFGQHLARGKLAVSDARHQIVDLAESIVGGDLLQLVVFDFFERNAIFARFFSISLRPISMARSR